MTISADADAGKREDRVGERVCKCVCARTCACVGGMGRGRGWGDFQKRRAPKARATRTSEAIANACGTDKSPTCPHSIAPAPAQTRAISADGRTNKPRDRAGEGEAEWPCGRVPFSGEYHYQGLGLSGRVPLPGARAKWESTVTGGSGSSVTTLRSNDTAALVGSAVVVHLGDKSETWQYHAQRGYAAGG